MSAEYEGYERTDSKIGWEVHSPDWQVNVGSAGSPGWREP